MIWDKKRWPSFSESEFRCKCGCGKCFMDPAFLDDLQFIRFECGFPLMISSGYRCPEYNAKVSDTGDVGPHTTGKAADILVYGEKAHKLLAMAIKNNITGIGIKQKGNPGSRFIHLDILPKSATRPWVWSY